MSSKSKSEENPIKINVEVEVDKDMLPDCRFKETIEEVSEALRGIGEIKKFKISNLPSEIDIKDKI